MCIIIAKEKKGKLPSMETLKTCFINNSDGAGIMYVDKGQVVIDKGYMKFEDLKKKLEILYKKFNNFKNKSLVIHCRIGTSGTNTRENTHPYCISDNFKDLHRTRILCDLGMVHNGIINQYTPIDNKHNTNDTQEFIMKYICPLYNHYKDFYKNMYILEGLEDITNSKLVFLDTNDDLYYVGEFIEDNGVKYSNGTYKPYLVEYYKNDKYFYNSYWNKNNKSYENEGYTYLDEQKQISNYSKNDLILLDEDWCIANEYGWEKVGKRTLYLNMKNYDLYEELDTGEMIKIGENTFVYDEHFEELF